MIPAAIIYLIIVAITSLWAFAAYGIDKRRAQTGSRRISEKNLIFIGLLGGWPGAFAAQQVFRHKTQKLSFQIVFWGTVVTHLGWLEVSPIRCGGSSSPILMGEAPPDRPRSHLRQ